MDHCSVFLPILAKGIGFSEQHDSFQAGRLTYIERWEAHRLLYRWISCRLNCLEVAINFELAFMVLLSCVGLSYHFPFFKGS